MESATAPVILLTGPPADRGPLSQALGPAGFQVDERPANGLPPDLASFAAVILDGRDPEADVLLFCRRLSLRPLDDRPPLLVMTADDTAAARAAAFSAGADAVIAP